ncbi:3-oxoacyl-ACP synthase III [Micrococcus terreus]|uniref:3-oxoacyl-ACP synthase III n=1 Tax=Micrococcus TaxID=1269 RepID=UPI0021A73B70|nr:3-oxoacyl-ACP synthase III [Micrococcus terreus]MCT2089098.1 3-oxoacyl-ACP synthase III [Micrococcus terreus]MDK7700197.1 3-oxoacyl-ACP synthase III [Micrococcus terreus]WOO98476.1 3-oxoacyl-ACP synthase III [Micrococcus terreus]
MQGNAIFRHTNASLLSVTEVVAPVTVTSDQIDDELVEVLTRLKLPRGLLQRVAGVHERRNWEEPDQFQRGAAEAGRAALEQAGVDASAVGLLVNTSVTRQTLEPSVAVRIHHEMGLPTSATNFDITNACLAFVNGMSLAATMIDAGQIDYAVVVAGEDSVKVQRATLANLHAESVDRSNFMEQFASLTLGSGAAAAVIGRSDLHPEGHRIRRGITRAGTDHHDLCVGDHEGMFTDSTALLKDGLELVMDAWNEVPEDWNWGQMDRYITHQVSQLHTDSIIEAAGIDRERIPTTFPVLGNVGPASLPITLAREADSLQRGDRVLCLGVGSGLNTAMLEIDW